MRFKFERHVYIDVKEMVKPMLKITQASSREENKNKCLHLDEKLDSLRPFLFKMTKQSEGSH